MVHENAITDFSAWHPNDFVGVYEQEGLVQYIANGLPIFAHGKDDLHSFRYITSLTTTRVYVVQGYFSCSLRSSAGD